MGTEFWWFYDVIAVAIVLVCVYFSGRKGFAGSAVSLIGYAIGLVVAFSVSGAFSEGIYRNILRSSNVKKISQSLDDYDFIDLFDTNLENAGYNIVIKREQVEKIFATGSDIDAQMYKYVNNINGRKIDEEGQFYIKLHETYANTVSSIVSKQLNKFAAETAAEAMRDTNDTSINELAPLLLESSKTKSAGYIADNYTAPAYRKIIKLMCFVFLLVIVILLSHFLIKALDDSGHKESSSHILGGFIGIGKGGVLVLAAAAAVRLWVIMGSNEMLFFNFEAIDKSYIFRYFYNLVLNM